MKATRKDKRQDFLLKLIKPLARLWMFFDAKREVVFDESFDPKRQEPYVLLANHTFMFDVVHVPLDIKKVPFIVAQHNLFTKQPLKFILEEIAHAIPKSKGASDLRTARELIGAVKRGYPVCIFPEGNTTFNGETNYIEPSTMKLIRKLGVDVVTCKIQGGYLSKPRWATSKRKNRKIKMTYKVVVSKEDVSSMSIDEINDIVVKELYNNDYEYQREVMVKHPGKNKAEGLENVLYICSECESIGTLETHQDEITCSSCKKTGVVNDYGFIEGLRFDNTVDWDNWQRQFNFKLSSIELTSPMKIYEVNDLNLSREYLGEGKIVCIDRQFILSGPVDLVIPFEDVKNPIVTLRRNFNIYYQGKHYLIKIEQYVSSFLRVIQEKY